MGMFDSIFGKKTRGDEPADPEPAVTAPTTWRERREQATRHEDFEWDWGNERAHALVHEILQEAAPHFGDAKIKAVPDDENIDLRGTFDGAPIRFAVWMSFGSFWTIQMRCPNRVGELYVERDREKIPKQQDADDPWDEDEERRIFLAKGIFVEGSDGDVADKLDTWSKLPESLRTRILADMERLDVRMLVSYTDDITLNQRPGLGELDDPISYMEDCARLLAEIKNELAKGDRDPSTVPSVQIRGAVEINGVRIEPNVVTGNLEAHARLTCQFCSSMYLLTPANNNCPNCGAPPRS